MMRRAFVLIAVLVITSSALLVATSVIFMVQADSAGASGALGREQSRRLVWSGLQAIATRLDEQRDRLLDGELPQLDGTYVLYDADGRQGVLRLLPVGPAGERLVPESARLDLNIVDADALVATEFVDEPTAAAIIAYRDRLSRPFQSVSELLHVAEVDAETLYGPLEDLNWRAALNGEEPDLGERVAARLRDTEPRGLADIVTVYAAEPAIQRSGDLRINLDVPWSDELGRRIEDRFGQGASRTLRRLMVDDGQSFPDESRIFATLVSLGAAPEDWPNIVDALTAAPGNVLFGRLNINHASAAALRGLPGITPEQADALVQARDSVSADDRATVVWPLLNEVLEAGQYSELGPQMTTRSWTFRLRVAAGEIDADEDPDTAPLLDPVVYETVIDLVEPRPRIAYMRDITLLPIAATLVSNAELGERDERKPRSRGSDAADPSDEAVDDAAEMLAAESTPVQDDAPERRELSFGEMASTFSTPSTAETAPPNDDETAPDMTLGPVSPPPPPARRRVGRWQGGQPDS